MTEISKERAACKEFADSCPKAVFATVDEEGKPHSGLMLYVMDDEWNVYFGTKKSSSKYPSLLARPDIAVTIVDGTSDPLRTVDVTGTAEELLSEEREKWLQYFKEKNKSAYYVENAEDYTMFRIRPTSVRFADATSGKLVATDIL